MRHEDYDDMRTLESDFWWFAGMRRISQALLRRHLPDGPLDLLDVGCGTGINLLRMAAAFPLGRAVGCELSGIALDWCRETLRVAPAGSVSPIPRLSRGDVRHLPFAPSSFDLLTSLDVLNLLEGDGEDANALAELHRVLRPGGLAFVREPAYQWLLCSHDALFETRHRYTAGELKRKLEKAGLRVIASTYANTLLFPAAAARRLLRRYAGVAPDRTDTQPWPPRLRWLNPIFQAFLLAEAGLLRLGARLPFGLSAICLAVKPAGSPAENATVP